VVIFLYYDKHSYLLAKLQSIILTKIVSAMDIIIVTRTNTNLKIFLAAELELGLSRKLCHIGEDIYEPVTRRIM